MNSLLALNLYSNPGFKEEALGSTGSKTPVGVAESLFKSLLMKENTATSETQTGQPGVGTAGNRQNMKRKTGHGPSVGTKQTLETALFGSGFLAGMVKLPPEAGEKLTALLQEHGFSGEQSRSLIKGATDKDGFIHLDRLIAGLGQSKTSVTKDQTNLMIASRDVPQFQEVLFKMGLGAGQVKSLVENCDDGAGNMPLQKVYSELSGKFPMMGSQETLIHLLSHFGIRCRPENVPQAINSKELLALMKDYAAAPSEDTQQNIKSSLAGILQKKGVPPQEVKSFLEGMTVEYARSVARSGTAQDGKSATAAKVGLWNGMVLKPQHEMKEGPWTEKILAILKDSPNDVKNGAGNDAKGQDNSLRSLFSQLMGKENTGGNTLSGKTATVLTSGEAQGAAKDLLKTTAEKAGEGLSALAGTMVSGSADPDMGSGKVTTAAQDTGINASVLDHTQTVPFVSQAVDRMQWMVEAGEQRARIQLSPPELGHIDIQLVMDQGHLRASLGTESMHVKEMIQSNLGQLKQQLSQMGFVVDEFNVNVGLDNRKSSSDEDQWARKAQVGAVKGTGRKMQVGPILNKAVPMRTPINTDYQVSVRV
jgi:Flagellar hook-length control protein FliK